MIIHLDFETYFDSKYSLTNMPTILYVRDPRFYMLGVSVAIGDGPHVWMDEAQFVDFADTVDWAHTEVNAYNNAFDSCILTQRFNIFPGRYMCSQSLARGLLPLEKYNLRNVAVALGMDPKKDGLKSGSKEVTPELIEYANHDNELSRQIYKLLLPFIPDKELDVIHQTVKKAVEPVLVLDREVLTEVLEKHISDREACIAASGYSEADLVSNQKFGAIIRSLGLEPPQSESKTTGEISDCFAKNEDAFVTFMLENPQYKHIWDARLQAKSNINVTRTQRLLEVAASGTMPMPQLYCGAHTGRSSGCLVADTQVIVYNTSHGVQHKRIVDVLLDDLVWDGEEFVEHEGVKFSGYQEVITYDGVTGTEDHRVFTSVGEISLSEAMRRGEKIEVARGPERYDVDVAIARSAQHKD